MVEEAEHQAEMGQSGELGELEEVILPYPSSPEYTASSPMYSASSPIVGQQIQPQQLQQLQQFASFVPAQMPASGYIMPQVLQPVQLPVPMQAAPVAANAAAVPTGSILSVAQPAASVSASDTSGSGSGEQSGGNKKVIKLNL
jgi:hypothetical protein